MAGECTIERSEVGGKTVLTVRGEVDLASAAALAAALAEGAEAGAGLTVDLNGLTYLDSAGVAVLFERAVRGGLEVLVGPDSLVAKVLEVTRLGEVAEVRAT